MNIPLDLFYTQSHEWVKFEGETTATIGLTEYAQEKMGDIVFVNLPLAGDEVGGGNAFADVESVKAVSDVFSPVTGTVTVINEALLDSPQLINENPYDAWFIRVEGITSQEELLGAADYEQFLASIKEE